MGEAIDQRDSPTTQKNSIVYTSIGWVLVAVLLVGYIAFQVMPLLGDRDVGIVGLSSHQNDYKHLYLGSYLLNQGVSPYNAELMLGTAGQMSQTEDPRFRTILPYVYLPFTGAVMTPLTWMGFANSAVTWMMLNHAFILGALVLAAVGFGWRGDPWVLVVLLAVTAFNTPVYRQNNAGQLNAALLFGMALLWLAIARAWHDAAIGAIAAFLMLFKLSPGIFLIYFLLRGEWKRAAWMIGWALVMTGVTAGIYGIQAHLDFLPVLRDMGYGKSTWNEFGHTFWRDPYNQSFNALFHRLLVDRTGSGVSPWMDMSAGTANLLTWAVSLSILLLFGWRTWEARRSQGIDEAPSLSLAICLSLLIPSILWDHYLTQLLLPMALLFLWEKNGPRNLAVYTALATAAVIACIPIRFDAEVYRSGAGVLMMNAKLIPVLICTGVALARRPH